MFADVSYDTATSKWAIFIEDYTTGYYYTNEFAFDPEQTTADWIVEDPSTGGLPTGVGTTTFSTAYWEDNYSSTTRPIDNSEVSTVFKSLLRPVGTTCLVPGSLTSSSTSSSFSITKQSSC
jgi:peptidase A4-like protein